MTLSSSPLEVRNVEIAKLLLAAGAPVDAVGSNALTPLMEGKRDGREDVAAYLVAQGARK